MSIVISIVKLPEYAVDTKSTHTFAAQGGTIGRSSDNDWALEDPERFISSQHSQISFENNQFYITDLSTNGTFLNGSAEPIGKSNTIKINDGDKFALGDYEFLASIWQPDESSIDLNQGPFSGTAPIPSPPDAAFSEKDDKLENDYFSSATASSELDGFASPVSGHVSNSDVLFSPESIETDPLAAMDNAQNIGHASPFSNDSFAPLSHSDQADPMQQSISWPESTIEAGAIPDDWNSDLSASPQPAINKAEFFIGDAPNTNNVSPAPAPAVNKKSELEKANEKILAEIEILKKQAQKQALQQQIEKNTRVPSSAPSPVKKPVSRSATSHEQTLIEALGLANNNLSEQKVVEINQVVGELVRETITGMMQVLSSRSTIKNEFRMNVTTIQPVENNPLKFSANVDDAIENMFIKDGNAYKQPVEAIKEGFEGIAEHQVAILAGIRTAFKGVLNRFDPAVLEQRFEQFNKPGIIPGMSKAKNWDSYKSYYQELIDDMDNSFQHLFGYEFVQAYEEQLQKLAVSRKTKNN